MWCYASEGGSVLLQSGLLSDVGLCSSELLNVKWLCTELQLLNLLEECSGCCVAVVGGVVRLKEICSLVEMWYI